MLSNELPTRKVAIVGAGFVGATSAYAVIISGLSSELVLIDINKAKLHGEVMDLLHGASFVKPVQIMAGDYPEAAGADVVVIAAGVNQKPGESRLDLVSRNAEVFREIVPRICRACPEAILLVVTNPVDVLTYVAWKISGFPANRVIGSGTLLDSSRFRQVLSDFLGVAAVNIHAYIIGEHGDTEVPVWSLANVAGVPLDEYCGSVQNLPRPLDKEKLFGEVRNAAYEIIKGKGATYYAVGLAVRRIMEALLRDENSILTVSSLVPGIYGVSDVCLSLPSIVNASGVFKVLELPVSPEERDGFRRSAETVKGVLSQLKISGKIT